MIPISKATIKRIQGLLQPGYLVQLEPVDNDIKISRVPKNPADIYINPTLACEDEKVMLELRLYKANEEPVSICNLNLPENYWVTGVMGAFSPPRVE